MNARASFTGLLKGRFAQSQLHSLVRARRVQWQDSVETTGEYVGATGRWQNMPFNRLQGPAPDFLSGFTPLALNSCEFPTKQWG